MKRFTQISISIIILCSLLIPGGLSISPVSDVEAQTATTFAIVTDYGTGYQGETDVANMINGWHPEFIVTAGDNYQLSRDADVYPTYVGNYYGPGATPGRTDFINFSSPSNFWPVPGNHDYYAGGGDLDRYIAYFSYLPPSGAFTGATAYYYDVVRGPVHFFMIDSGNGDTSLHTYMTAQMTWLEAALRASTSPWNIVMFHQPAASAGSHGSKAKMDYDYGSWGADFVIGGHNHIYERINYRGIVHITAGAGGGNGRTEYDTSKLPTGAETQAHYAVLNSSGAMKVVATDTEITFQYITTDGTIQDEATYPEPASTCTTVTLDAIADTYISASATTTNYGNTDPLLVDGDNPDASALIKWDISSIPSGMEIDSASITLNVINNSGGDQYEIYQLLQNWVEGNNTTGSGADWIDYDTTNDWQTAGAQGANDRGTIALGAVGSTTTGSFSFSLNQNGVDLIQNWVDGSVNNYGVIIQDYAEADGFQFSSSENATSANRPKLTITYCQPVDIGDFVWVDDGDGIQETGEPGLEGVTVNLRNSSDDSLAMTTTTDTSGLYGFSSVPTGNYYVEFVSPTGYAFTLLNQGGDDALDSDADLTTGRTAAFAWTAGGTPIDNIDAGLVVLTLGDRVWLDLDKDGIQDAEENGLSGVIVRLLNTSGLTVGSTYTDASGNYSFPTPAPGQYFIQFELPGGYTYSPKDSGADDLDSDAKMATGTTDVFTVDSTTTSLNFDCGMWQSLVPGQCVDITFQQDVSPSGYSGTSDTYIQDGDTTGNGAAVTVYWDYSPLKYALVRFDDIFGVGLIPPDKIIKLATLQYVVSTDTGEDAGVYEVDVPWNELVLYSDFGGDSGLQPDEYSELIGTASGAAGTHNVNVTASLQRWYADPTLNPNYGWIFIQSTDGGVQFASSENVTSSNRPALTVTYCDPSSYNIGDEVWKDSDKDGLQDNLGVSEFAGGGVIVKLWTQGGVLVQTTKSTYDNSYGFSNIPAGHYYIEFELPDGYEYTLQDFGSDDAIDSDADATSGITDVFYFDGTTTIGDIDAGFTGGYTCYAMADGLAYDHDDEDSLIQVDLLTAKGTLIATSTATGIEAGALDPDTGYIYTFNTATWGYINTANGSWQEVGSTLANDTCVDQNGNTQTVSGTQGFDAVAYNPIDETWWAAMRLDGTPLDVLVKINKATGDLDLDSTYFTGTATCVSIAAPAGNTNLTDIDDMAFSSDGTLYVLANRSESEGRVVVPTKVGSEYTGAVTDLGTIWRADLNEEINDIEGFSIDENGRVWVTTGGWNIEDNVDHDTLFEILNLSGGGTLIAVPHVQLSIADSLINGAPGINYTDIEAVTCYGTSSPGTDNRSSIGNFIWLDADVDGIFDAGEVGIANVLLELYGPGLDGQFGTADDVLLNTTTTVNGNYLFGNLPAGVYQVRVAASNFAEGGALKDMFYSYVPDGHLNEEGYNQPLPYTVNLPWDTDITTADFAYSMDEPTSVTLLYFTAADQIDSIKLAWETATSTDILGFNILRSLSSDIKIAEYLTSEMIPSLLPPGSPIGAYYEFLDENVEKGLRYYYWLETIDINNQNSSVYGPVDVMYTYKTFIPFSVK